MNNLWILALERKEC